MTSFLDRILGKDEAGRVRSIQYLGNMKDEDSRAKLIRYLGDESPAVRSAAAVALEQHCMTGDPNAIAALTKALDDADPGVRKNAVLALGRFVASATAAGGSDDAKKAIIGLLGREADAEVIKNAVIGLANIQDPALNGRMAEAFRGRDRKVTAMAIDAINDLPPTDARLEMKKALRSVL